MGKRINRFIGRLPPTTKLCAAMEVFQAGQASQDFTAIRKVLPGEEPRKTDWKCAGKTWEADVVKKGAIQMCPQQNLQFIRYHIPFDMVQRYCPRCATYMIAHPEDIYLTNLNIPIECPKMGWRPDPMPEGWKP
jgi:hypothetical protein